MIRVLIVLWAVWLQGGLQAQEQDARELLGLRVIASRAGVVDVDRGSFDGLALGDRVRFTPREGAPFEGSVERVDERSAVVTLDDTRVVATPGTRGEVQLPGDRRAASHPPSPPRRANRSAPPHRQWPNRDEKWTPEQPLLSRVRPLKPAQRPATVTGRWYSILDHSQSSEGDRADSFARAGLALDMENFLGQGELFQLDGEFNWRRTDVDDNDDEELLRGRLDRLSYARGGTRFDDARLELGRFLLTGMPEFGLLDGFEWWARLDSGQRYGVSLGFLPEPTPEQSTGEDLQFAAFYRWCSDTSERLTIAAGYQKSLHDLDADRDLLLLAVHGSSELGWQAGATAWIDYYTDSDTEKDAGLEPTQVLAHAGRRWDSGSAFDIAYAHFAYPDIERDGLSFSASPSTFDARNDRLTMLGRRALSRAWFFTARGGIWADQDDDGFDLELGTDVRDWLSEDTELHLACFGTDARFESEIGGRVGFEFGGEDGAWQVQYELSDHRIDGFTGSNNDLPTHRIGAWRDWHSNDGWSASARAELVLWDDERAGVLGLYFQRSF